MSKCHIVGNHMSRLKCCLKICLHENVYTHVMFQGSDGEKGEQGLRGLPGQDGRPVRLGSMYNK